MVANLGNVPWCGRWHPFEATVVEKGKEKKDCIFTQSTKFKRVCRFIFLMIKSPEYF